MSDTFIATIATFSLPFGIRRDEQIELPFSCHPLYADMEHHGCRLEGEILRTGEISVTISDPEEGLDVDIFITENKREVIPKIIEMLEREEWKKEYKDQGE